MTTLPPSLQGDWNLCDDHYITSTPNSSHWLDANRIGAGNRVRTGDLNLGKVALYQLSYSRTLLRVATAVVAGTGEAARPATTLARLRSTN